MNYGDLPPFGAKPSVAELDEAIKGWQEHVDNEKRAIELGICLVPSAAYVRIDSAERVIKSLTMQKKDGVARCSQCFKPWTLNNRGFHSCIG